MHVRKAIVKLGDRSYIDEVKVKVEAHVDKETGKELPNDLFVGWGHKAEKTTPLMEQDLVRFFDAKHDELTAEWRKEGDQMSQILSVGKMQRAKNDEDEAKRAAARKTNELQGMWATGQLPPEAQQQQAALLQQ